MEGEGKQGQSSSLMEILMTCAVFMPKPVSVVVNKCIYMGGGLREERHSCRTGQ